MILITTTLLLRVCDIIMHGTWRFLILHMAWFCDVDQIMHLICFKLQKWLLYTHMYHFGLASLRIHCRCSKADVIRKFGTTDFIFTNVVSFVPLWSGQSSGDSIGRHRATLVFNAWVKSRTAFAGSMCQRLAALDEIAGTLNASLSVSSSEHCAYLEPNFGKLV